MAGEVGALRVTLGVNSSQFEAGMRAAQRTAKQTGQNISAALKKSAEESASVFIQGDKAAKRLVASLDPLVAAQMRYNDTLAEAKTLYKQGSLSAEEFANVQTRLKAQLDGQTQQFQRVGGAAGNLRGGMQQLSFQLGDIAQGFALGTRPMTIFAQQSGQVVQSIQLMGGQGNKFLQFLGGPWGLALATAGQLLVLFALKAKDAGESVDSLVGKMQKEADQARLNEQANKIWERSIDGVIEAQRKLREEIARSITVEQVANQQKVSDAKQRLNDQQALLASEENYLNTLRERLKVASRPVSGEGEALAQIAELKTLDGLIKRTEANIAKLKPAIEVSTRAIREAGIAVGRDYATAVTDASQAVEGLFAVASNRIALEVGGNQKIADSIGEIEASIKRASDAGSEAASAGASIKGIGDQVRDLTKGLVSGRIGPEAFTKSINAMVESLRAAAEAAKAAKKETSNLPKVSGQEIAKALGTTITSGTRTPAQNAAAKGAANSYHLSGQAIDIPLTVNGKPLTKEGIRSVLEPLGVQIKELLGPGDRGHNDHFHIAFDKRRLGSDDIARRQETAANRLEAEAQRGIRKENVFEERREQLNTQLLQAKAELLQDSAAEAALAAQIVRQEQARANIAIQNDVEEKKLTQAQANILILQNTEIANRKLLNIEIRAQVQALREQDHAAQQEHELTLERLRFIDEMATTQDAHRRAQHEILDLVYEEKRRQLEALAILAEKNGNLQDAADSYRQIAALPEQRARDEARVDKATQGPLESYMESLPQTAAEINEALESVAVEGLRSLEDGILSVIDGTKSLGEAFRDMASQIIADLLRIQIQRGIANILGSLAGGLGGGGGLPIPIASGTPIPGGFGFASGGFTGFGPKNRIAGVVHAGEFVMPASTVARLGVGNLEKLRQGLPTDGSGRITARGGDTYSPVININAPMSDRQARETASQAASAFQRRITMAKRAGM